MSKRIKDIGKAGIKCRDASTGFTLIEVVIATMLGATGLACIFLCLSFCINQFRSAANRTQAIHEARSAMEYLKSCAFTDDELTTGIHTMQYNDLHFQYAVSEGSDPTVKELIVQVGWHSAHTKKMKYLELSSMLSSSFRF